MDGPALVVRQESPFNAETPREALAADLHTPNELFYVRSHLPAPHIAEEEYRLTVEGEGLRTVELTMDDVKTRFEPHTVSATLQCAGNRRHELKEVKPIEGVDWDVGAIGNAAWTGARLVDVLKHAGWTEEAVSEVEHIQFEGYDTDSDGGNGCYGASVPADKAADPRREVVLAYLMNGEELTLHHGYPLRVVAPGIAGTRSVKWLRRIIASKSESASHWQQQDYKAFSPAIDSYDKVDWNSAPAIQETSVTSAITDPPPDSMLPASTKTVAVRGYAYSGGGRGIVRVEVTADDGGSWTMARTRSDPQKQSRHWSWTLWEADIEIPEAVRQPGSSFQVAVRAVDADYAEQPEDPARLWNIRGVLNNAWHRIKLHVKA